VRYGDVRPYAVPEDLAQLSGPVEGVVVLPTSLDWTPKQSYDLADDVDVRLLYETVLREAMHTEELVRHVNGDLLARVWSRLWLPLRLRVMWESRFPDRMTTPHAASRARRLPVCRDERHHDPSNPARHMGSGLTRVETNSCGRAVGGRAAQCRRPFGRGQPILPARLR